MLEKVKLALRVTANEFDEEITDDINAACADLGIVGLDVLSTTTDANYIRAIITYCKANFGHPEKAVHDMWMASYNEQKAQLISCTGYGLE